MNVKNPKIKSLSTMLSAVIVFVMSAVDRAAARKGAVT